MNIMVLIVVKQECLDQEVVLCVLQMNVMNMKIVEIELYWQYLVL